MLASSLLAGMVAGQLIGGALGDSFLGLTGALTLVMLLQLVASLGSASVAVHSHDFYWTLAAWRLVLGIGAGAVYPLAACLSVEQGAPSSCKDHETLRVKRVVWTFAMQGVGFWIVPFLATLLVFVGLRLDIVWRILLGAGCLPGIALLYLQYRVLFYEPNNNDDDIVAPEHLAVVENDAQVGDADTTQDDHNPTTESEPDDVLKTKEEKLNSETEENAQAAESRENGDVLQTSEKEEPFDQPHSEEQIPVQHLSERSPRSHELEGNMTNMTDRDLHDDSDGEVGTFLDSSPDMEMSSAGVFRESERPVINAGWLVSLQTEERLGRKLLGTAVTWFLFDVLFYGNTLFQPVVIEQVFGSRKSLGDDALIRRVVCDSLVLNSIALPGYIVAALLIGEKTCGITQSPRCKWYRCALYIFINTCRRDLVPALTRYLIVLLLLLFLLQTL